MLLLKSWSRSEPKPSPYYFCVSFIFSSLFFSTGKWIISWVFCENFSKFYIFSLIPCYLGSACNAGYPGSIPGLGTSPGEENGYPLQCSCLENSMDRGALWATVHGVTKSQTRLSNQHFYFQNWHNRCLLCLRGAFRKLITITFVKIIFEIMPFNFVNLKNVLK